MLPASTATTGRRSARSRRTTVSATGSLGADRVRSRVALPVDAGLSVIDVPTRTARGSSCGVSEVLSKLEANRQIAARYVGPDGEPARECLEPERLAGAVAGVCDPSGRLFG